MTLSMILGLMTVLAAPQTFASAPAASPSPAVSGAPSAAPSALTPAASASPAPLFSPAPVAPDGTATLGPDAFQYRFVPRQPASPAPGQPQIFAVYLNAKHLKSHGPIVIRVETSSSVVKVESKSNGRGGAIPMVAPGVFFAATTLPAIPFIASGMTTDLIFTGTSADGRTVVVKVPVELG